MKSHYSFFKIIDDYEICLTLLSALVDWCKLETVISKDYAYLIICALLCFVVSQFHSVIGPGLGGPMLVPYQG